MVDEEPLPIEDEEPVLLPVLLAASVVEPLVDAPGLMLLVEALGDMLLDELDGDVLVDAEGAVVLVDADGVVVALCDVVVSVLGDFLCLFMSPMARAEPLARVTRVVMMKAGASLRMVSS